MFLQRVDIYCGDWSSCSQSVEGKAFYFMDPPYRDSFTQYGQSFDDNAHIKLINFCKQEDLKGNYVYYCNRDAGDDFYDVNRGQLVEATYPITYTAGRRKQSKDDEGNVVAHAAKAATEILLYSPVIDTLNCKIIPAAKKPKSKSKTVDISSFVEIS